MEVKHFKEKDVQKSVKSCNYPELSVQISCVFIKQTTIWLPSQKNLAIIRKVQLLACNYPETTVVYDISM